MTTSPSHTPPPGAGVMNVVRMVLLAGLVLLAVAAIVTWIVASRATGAPGTPAAHTAQAAKPLYRCPMHPNYTSDRPGECPICGMTLEKVEPGEAAGASGDVPGLAEITIGSERTQRIGVRTAIAEESGLSGALELFGFVTPDESKLRQVQIRVSGWVQSLAVDQTGASVTAGQPLLSLYSPELYQTEQEYLVGAIGAHDDSMPGMRMDRATPGAANPTLQRLKLMGVPEDELARLARERTPSTKLVLRAPVSGTVLERGVAQGQYVGPDTPLLTLGDLSRPWILADVYEMDLGRVHLGDLATLTVDAVPGETFAGKVTFVYPTLSSQTRTLKVRIEVADPQRRLKPGMYGRVRLATRGARGLLVPQEAVIRAGENDYVFVAHAGGRFEPRLVTTGAQDGDRVQVLRGLAAGDTVVASASFLIDSESRMKAAIAGMGESAPGAHAGHQP